MKNRILAFGLTLAMILSLFCAMPAMAAQDKHIQLLNDLGIIEPEQKTGLIKKGFTRGDFAKTLVLMDGEGPIEYKETDANGKLYATDIASDKNRDAIVEVILSGLMKTDENGKFNPNKPLTKYDAVYAFVKMLGYETVALKNGGTETDYYVAAGMMGLFKGIGIEDESQLAHSEVEELLANAMGIRFFRIRASLAVRGISCYYDYFKLTNYRGRILANSNFGLAVGNTDEGEVNIDGKIYRTNLLIEDELVGSVVSYYIQNVDGHNTVVSVSKLKESDNVTVLVKDICDIEEDDSTLTIIYNEDEEISIEKNGFAIVNTKTMQPSKNLFEKLNDGSITFIKSEGAGNYDLAQITMIKQDVIDGISAEYGTLALRYSGQKIDLEVPAKCEIYVGKKAADISQLKAGMPVGVVCDAFTFAVDGSLKYDFSKAKTIKLYASNSVNTGIVEGVSDEEYYIDDLGCEPGPLYKYLLKKALIEEMSVGTGVNVYLDNYGQIAYYEINPELNSMKYGYLLGVSESRGNLNKYLKFRIMDIGGNINEYITERKFFLDGNKVNVSDAPYTVGGEVVDFTKRQVVKFLEIDGILKRLDTLAMGANESEGSSLTRQLDCNPYDLTGAKRYTQYRGVVNSQYAIAENTVVFMDEGNLFETGVPEDYKFSVIDSSSIPSRVYIDCYDVNDTKEAGCAVVYTECGVAANQNSDIMSPLSQSVKYFVVEKVVLKIDAEGNEAFKLICAGDGKKVELNVPKETLKLYTSITNDDVNNNGDYTWASTVNGIGTADQRPQKYVSSNNFMSVVGKGDVIRYRTTANGDVNYIERVFDFSEAENIVIPVPESNGKYFGFVNVDRSLEKFYIYSENTFDTNGKLIDYIVGSVTDLVPVYNVRKGTVTLESFAKIPTKAAGQTAKAFVAYYDYVRQPTDHIFYLYD